MEFEYTRPRLMTVLFARSRATFWGLFVRLAPDSPRGWSALGRTLALSDRDLDADQALERAVRLYESGDSPNHRALATCLVERAHGLVRLGRPRRAAPLYARAMYLLPDDPEIPFSLANALYEAESYTTARRHYRSVLTLAPNHARAWFNLGHTSKALGSLSDAAIAFERALELDPHFYKARFMRAHVLTLLGRTEEAIAEYQTTLKASPGYIKAHYNLGNCHLKQGQIKAAMRRYEAVLKLDRTYDKAWFALGQAALRVDDSSRARNAFVEALRLRPDLHACRLQLARLLERMGNAQEAMLHYRVFLRDAPRAEDHADVECRLTTLLRPRRASATRPALGTA